MTPSVEIHTEERPTWKLTRAVLVYESERFAGQRSAYATVHDVDVGAKGVQLRAGVPATREACADIARSLGAASTLGGFLPPQLLYLGATSIIWWRPPQRTRVFFNTTKDAAVDQPNDKTGAALIGKRSGVVPHPGLVFAVAGGNWYVYALRGDGRPDPDAALHRAPYFNVWASGQICTGNVRLPESLSTGALATYETAFFDSEFTHPNVHGRAKLVRAQAGAYAFWRELLDHGRFMLEFPTQQLVDANLTLAGLAKRLEEGRRA